MGQRRPLFISVNGTGVPDPFGPGFSGDIGRALSDPWRDILVEFVGATMQTANTVSWQPTGYPAAVAPMGPSVAAGRVAICENIAHQHTPGYPLFLSGYSQGAIAVGQTYVNDFLNPSGIYHSRLPDLQAGGIINFGDPLRCPGIARGNEVAGLPAPSKLDGVTTGGIAGNKDLKPEQTSDNLLSCALDGDLYAAAPVGDDPWSNEAKPGLVETSIYNIIMQASFGSLLKIASDLALPLATIQAIYNGLKFAAAGTNAPHWQYGPFIPSMVDWVRERVRNA